jgi:trans-aconitate methyltransferase
MLRWCAARLERTLRQLRPRRLLSLGVGHQAVCHALSRLLGTVVQDYTVVEGSATRIAELQAAGTTTGLQVVQAYFEEYLPPEPVDAIEMGFVLEHVDDPASLLRRYAEQLAPGGLITIAVPNARSLHRLVGQRAGLLADLYSLSDHDRALGHKRYFDLDSLGRLVAGAGLRARVCEGIFLKCLTTAQLEQLALSPALMQAFCAVAVDHPDIANAIYLEAHP